MSTHISRWLAATAVVLDMGAYEFDNSANLTPGEMLHLRFPDKLTLTWGAVASIASYGVYRADLPLGYGTHFTCLGTTALESFLIGSATPPPGGGFAYLVTARDPAAGAPAETEGTLGRGTCAERANPEPCQ